MIVSFSVANFRSFGAEETLSMVASQRLADSHEEHALPIPGSNEKVLRVGVLYGANGAGKSNLFKALSYVRTRALRTRKKNSGTRRDPFRCAKSHTEPSSFELRFIAEGKLFDFGFKADDVRITEEWLIRIEGDQECILYERVTETDGTVLIEAPGLQGISKKLEALVTVGGPQNQTFLATVRATLGSADYAGELLAVIQWFEKQLRLIAPTENVASLGHLLSRDDAFMDFAGAFLQDASTGIQKLEVNKRALTEEELRAVLPNSIVERALRIPKAGPSILVQLGSENEALIERSGENQYHLLTVGAEHEHQPGEKFSLEIAAESDGTRRLLNLLPALHHLRQHEGIYFIDEIDRSLHPLLAWKFLDFFLKSCAGAQRQIFVTTHETNLLDLELLRRDEVWFVEKEATGASHLYSLADFKERKDLEVRKHYLQGRFGAIPFLGNLDRLLKENKEASPAQETAA